MSLERSAGQVRTVRWRFTLRALGLSQIPIRGRLALLFAIIMAAILLFLGAFLYWRLSTSLDDAIDAELQARFDSVSTALAQADTPIAEASAAAVGEGEELVVQALSPKGAVLGERGGLTTPLLVPAEVQDTVRSHETVFAQARVPGSDEPFRLLTGPVASPDGTVLAVVGRSTEDRAEALEGLLTQFLLGGPLVLVLSSLLTYVLTAAALRPVESMRREAEVIGAGDQPRRLPVPSADDEISRLATTLNEMLDRLEASVRRERAFVADASHELRTPLAILRMEAELALRSTRTERELRVALRAVVAESDRLGLLADDLLVLARADQGELVLRPERLPVAGLLHSVAERFAPLAEDAQRRLIVYAPAGLVISGDKDRLERAFGNLVDNALRHGRGEVMLRAQRSTTDAALIEVHVLDDGPGFPVELLPHVFERFSRADRARSTEGAGLGLSIVRAIAAAHGGRAGARNRQDGGADVYMVLPTSPPVEDKIALWQRESRT